MRERRPESCRSCGRRFSPIRWRRRCGACEAVVCRACLHKVALPPWVSSLSQTRVCEACHGEKAEPLEQRYRSALARRIEIIAYLGPYKGDPGPDPASKLPIESGFHESKDDAVRELQTMAAFHGRDGIEELRFFEESVREAASRPGEGPVPFGEQRRSLWKAAGTAMRLGAPMADGS